MSGLLNINSETCSHPKKLKYLCTTCLVSIKQCTYHSYDHPEILGARQVETLKLVRYFTGVIICIINSTVEIRI